MPPPYESFERVHQAMSGELGGVTDVCPINSSVLITYDEQGLAASSATYRRTARSDSESVSQITSSQLVAISDGGDHSAKPIPSKPSQRQRANFTLADLSRVPSLKHSHGAG